MSETMVVKMVVLKDQTEFGGIGTVGRLNVQQAGGIGLSRVQGGIRVDFPEGHPKNGTVYIVPFENIRYYQMERAD